MSEVSTTQRLSSEPKSSHQLSLQSPRWLHIILMIVAIAAWMIFILACVGGPAWSPDGSQLLFAYRDVENSRNSVALYDRKTGQVRTIFSQPTEKSDKLGIEPEWQNDGTRALLTLYQHLDSGDGTCELLSIPVKSKLPLQAYGIGSAEGCIGPHAQLGNKIYFGGNRLRWIDLVTGEIGNRSFGEDAVLVAPRGSQLSYIRDLSRPTNKGEGEPQTETGWEFGHMDAADPALNPDFTLWLTERIAQGMKSDDPPTVYWDREGSRMAMIANGGDSDRILLFDGDKGYQRTLVPDLGVDNLRLGNLVWSEDGNTLYASAFIKTASKEVMEYSLAEIPLAGTRGRLTKLASVRDVDDGDFAAFLAMSMHVSLSPDGNLIAATPAVLDKKSIDARDRALFLINLRSPARPAQRIPIRVSPPNSVTHGAK